MIKSFGKISENSNFEDFIQYREKSDINIAFVDEMLMFDHKIENISNGMQKYFPIYSTTQ